MITLSPERELVDALTSGFTPDALERRVMDPLRVPPEARSEARDYRARVVELVRWASAESRLGDLLRTAREANPSSGPLQLLSEALGLVPATSDLVDAIRAALPKDGEAAWQRGLREVRRQVCVIENKASPSQASGTGFLVGPDLVMTHVTVLAGSAKAAGSVKPKAITVAFDRTDDSARIIGVREVLVATSDVIVLRCERPVGRETTADGGSGTSARARGWLAPSTAEPTNRAVVIVQYVEGRRLAVSVDPYGLMQDANVSDGLIRYKTSSQGGSMGAPLFDAQWRLLGMHVGADREHRNQGIAIAKIVDELRAKRFLWDVTSGVARDPSQIKQEKSLVSLDELVAKFSLSANDHDDADDVWTSDVECDAPAGDRWAWAEAAAVTAYFDPEKLKPSGNPSLNARVAILFESSPVHSSGGDTRWMLAERIRVRALQRLANRGELAKLRKLNPGDSGEILDAVLGNFIAGVPATRAELQDPDRLRAMLEVAGWLAGTGITVAPKDELEAALERAMLIAPFRHLTRGFFAGRETELATLAAYVDGPDVDQSGLPPPPILVFGPGGMGKSALLAHFILAHSERDATKPESWRPFVYLDFDRPELDARDQAGVLIAMAHQIGQQVPKVRDRADAVAGKGGELKRARRQEPDRPSKMQLHLAPRASMQEIDDIVAELASIMNAAHDVLPAPLVLVLDTLEEVQYSTPDAVVPLADLVVKLRAAVASLCPVLAGRIEIDSTVKLTPLPLGPLPPHAAEALLSNHLPPVLASKKDLVARMVQIVGGNPLSLRLAAEVLRHETDANLQQLGEEELWQRVGDAIVQGQLYERILDHLHESPIKQLAIPGLVLRYLTRDLIRYVLAEPCGVEVKDDAAAQSLFDDLSKEIAVVRSGRDDATKLVLRPELRRTVLDGFRRDPRSAGKRRLIHEAAVRFFSPLPNADNRAEEIYHRLCLDQEPTEIDSRWLTGVDIALRNAVEDLDGRARTYLAQRLGGVDDAAKARTAAPAEWEEYATRRASDLLQLGSPAAALEVLRLRDDRLPASRLHLIESIALRSLLQPDLEAAANAAKKAVAAARNSPDPGDREAALRELVQVLRLRGDHEGVLRALSELGNLGEQLGDDLVLLGADVEALEAPVDVGKDADVLNDNAVRVFSRLPDELVARAPELARRVAAQVGRDNPAIIKRVIQLVGLGPLDNQGTAGLAKVLSDWARRDPDIQPFLPKGSADARELTSATQYLLANRNLDMQTAHSLSGWLKSVVTPTVATAVLHAAAGLL